MNTLHTNTKSEKVYARIGAKTIVVRGDGRMLVLRRSLQCSRPGGWDFPGGGSEFGEDPKQTAIRETLEETGLEISDIKLLTAYSYLQDDDQIVLLGFCSTCKEGEVKLSWEHDQFEWISGEEALRREWPEFHKKLLDEYMLSGFLPSQE